MKSQTAPPSQKLPFVSVDYDEFKPETYRGVTVQLPNDNKFFGHSITFALTGFEHDLENAEKYVKSNGFTHYLHSSSLDHFIQDSSSVKSV